MSKEWWKIYIDKVLNFEKKMNWEIEIGTMA